MNRALNPQQRKLSGRRWFPSRLATRIYVGIAVISTLFLVSISCGLYGTSRLVRNTQALIKAHAEADEIQQINLSVTDLQRLVAAYIATGDESTAAATRKLGQELKEQIAACILKDEGQDTHRHLSKMKTMLGEYLTNYDSLYDERKLRIQLMNEQLLPCRMKIHAHLNDLAQRLHDDARSSSSTLVLQASNDLSDAEGQTLRFLSTPDGVLANSALELVGAARDKLALVAHNAPNSELELLVELDCLAGDFRQTLIRVIQATRGYLAIDNVVMAGNSAEFCYQSNRVHDLTDQKLATLADDIWREAKSAFTFTVVICSAAIFVGISMACAFTRHMVKPISDITYTLNQLSHGEDVDTIPGLNRCDDIGDMARAANVFRSRNRQTLEDARNLRQKNDQIEVLLREFKKVADEAQIANLSKSEFLANMSHEIRTPMTAIVGFGELLIEQVEGDEAIEAASTILRNGQHLLDIINDILDLSKIESGKMSIESLECDPRLLAEEVIHLMSVRAEAKDLYLTVEVENDTPRRFTSDPTRIRQILVNLVGNAIKFTELGGVQLSVGYQAAENKISFRVTDSGIGMNDEQIGRLFKPFSQADTSVTRRFGGTGLGLSICKRLMELLGGAIEVQSEEGVGTTFYATIDAGRTANWEVESIDPAQQSSATEKYVGGSAGESLNGVCVLLAEDGPDNQRLISHILRKAGAHVVIAGNGQEAWKSALEAQAKGQAFDVILMDMQMPILDGYGASTKLREHGYLRPIIALTAHAMSGDREKCIDAGCDDFATKPLDRRRLIELVGKYASVRENPETYVAK